MRDLPGLPDKALSCMYLNLIGVDLNGGFGEYVIARPQMLYKLTSNIPENYRALIELLCIGFHATNWTVVKMGDIVAIWGTGKVGHCVLQAVKTKPNEKIFLIDLIDERTEKAKAGYSDVITINPIRKDPIKIINKVTDERGVDIAFEAVVGHDTSNGNTTHPVRGCINSIREAGKVCVLGLGNDPSPIIFKELYGRRSRL